MLGCTYIHCLMGGIYNTSDATPFRTVHHAVCPPSIFTSAPVMKLLAGLSRNTAAPLYSSGLLSLPSMFCVGHDSLRSGYLTNSASTMAVTMYPGLMVLTRMPYGPHSAARLRPSWMTAALDALYAGQIRPLTLSVSLGSTCHTNGRKDSPYSRRSRSCSR